MPNALERATTSYHRSVSTATLRERARDYEPAAEAWWRAYQSAADATAAARRLGTPQDVVAWQARQREAGQHARDATRLAGQPLEDVFVPPPRTAAAPPHRRNPRARSYSEAVLDALVGQLPRDTAEQRAFAAGAVAAHYAWRALIGNANDQSVRAAFQAAAAPFTPD